MSGIDYERNVVQGCGVAVWVEAKDEGSMMNE